MDASYGTNAGLRFGIAALGLTYAGAIVPTVKVCAVGHRPASQTHPRRSLVTIG